MARRLDDTDATFRMDAAVAEFAEILRHSYWAKGSDLANVVGLAKNAARDLGPRRTWRSWSAWPRPPGGSGPRPPDWREDIRPAWEPEDDSPQPKR